MTADSKLFGTVEWVHATPPNKEYIWETVHGKSMNFSLTETQRMYRKQLSEFVDSEIIGENQNWDAEDSFPHDVYDSLVNIGIIKMYLPEEVGGLDVDLVTAGLINEELGRGDVGFSMLVEGQAFFTHLLYEYGSPPQEEIALQTAEGETKLCFGLTEPGQGSDAQSLDTVATSLADGWVLNGEKIAITAATLADYCLVFAREENSGINGFLVPLDAEGVDVQPYRGMGCAVSGWGQIFLDDVEVDGTAKVMGKDGFKMAMETFDTNRSLIALYTLGAAEQTLSETVEYLKEREAFGQPLAQFEGPQFEIAEAKTYVDCARLKAYESLWKTDNGKPATKDAAMAKWFGPAVSTEAIKTCLILHGHFGYSEDFGIEKRLRDVIGQQIADGTPQISKLVIGRETFGRSYLPY